MFKSNNKVPVQKWEQINLWWLPRGCRRTKAKSRTDCPHTKRDEILVAQLGDLPYLDLLRDEPRNEVPTPICTMKIFNVAVVVGGDYPELRAPLWWKTKVVPQPFRIRYRSALWLRSNFLNPSEFHPCILTCSKKFLPWGWAIRWAIRWDVRGIWTIGPTKCRSLSESPPDLSVPQCVALVTSAFCVRKLFLLSQTESSANAH